MAKILKYSVAAFSSPSSDSKGNLWSLVIVRSNEANICIHGKTKRNIYRIMKEEKQGLFAAVGTAKYANISAAQFSACWNSATFARRCVRKRARHRDFWCNIGAVRVHRFRSPCWFTDSSLRPRPLARAARYPGQLWNRQQHVLVDTGWMTYTPVDYI